MDDYRKMLDNRLLDYVAITDHGCIDFAVAARQELGARIIVGEEIMTGEGELIGLFLTESVPAGLALSEAAARIHSQGGLVYVPHPFETLRSGVGRKALGRIVDEVDIIETHNGRAVFSRRARQAVAWAASHDIATAAASDAHGRQGWGNAYSIISGKPRPATLPDLLRTATHHRGMVGARGLLYPKYNRLLRGIRHV